MIFADFDQIFKLKGLLGVGAFGVVLLVQNRLLNQLSAVKIINKTRLSRDAIEVLKNESLILQSLSHKNIVKFKQILENEEFICLEMEYVRGGELSRLFKRDMGEREVSTVVRNILEGVNYIHERDYIH